MSQRQTFSLDSPARKFFACQLQHCSLSYDGNEGQWLYENGGLKFCFNQIWVQGIVVLVRADGNDFLLDDGTGIIEVTGVTKLVKDFNLHKGMYVMIAGKLKSLGSLDQKQYPTIKVLKIADLSSNLHSEMLWMMEVIDGQSQSGIHTK